MIGIYENLYAYTYFSAVSAQLWAPQKNAYKGPPNGGL